MSATSTIKWGSTYHYLIQHFGPPMPGNQRLGMWGFSIDLCPVFALKAKQTPLSGRFKKHMQSTAKRVGENCTGLEALRGEGAVNFWDGTLLLTNISVPGNACGLDCDREAFDNLGQEYGPVAVRYDPHNVDSMGQAAGLLSIWTTWFQVAFASLSESAK